MGWEAALIHGSCGPVQGSEFCSHSCVFVSVVRPIRNATSQGPFGIIPFNLI